MTKEIPGLFQEVLERWVLPEIARRRQAGTISDEPSLERVQIVIHPDRPTHEVRLNDETKMVFVARLKGPVEEGEVRTLGEFEAIEDILLTSEDQDAGHISAIFFKDSWVIKYGFRYFGSVVAQLAAAAEEFLAVAKFSLQEGHTRPFVENTWAAVELMAKGRLIAAADEQVRSTKKHGVVRGRFNMRLGRSREGQPYVRLLNELTEMRPTARFLRGDMPQLQTKALEMLETASEMLQDLRTHIPEIHELDDADHD